MTFCSRAVSTAHRTIEQFVPSPTRLPGLRSNHPTARAGRQTIGAPLTDPDGGLYSHAERQCKCRTMLVAQAALDGLRAPHSHARGGISWRGCRRDSRLRASRGSGGFAATNLRQRMSLRGRPAPASRRCSSQVCDLVLPLSARMAGSCQSAITGARGLDIGGRPQPVVEDAAEQQPSGIAADPRCSG